MKIVTIIGARPQFIKAAMVTRALRRHPAVTEILVHTGQHYDDNMSDVFFRELGIPEPNHHLGVGSGSHGLQTARMLEKIELVLQVEKPDWVLVYGDTNSTLAGALAGCKLHLPVAHVEAGLRSFNRAMPEEINRIVADHCADRHYAPTQTAVDHLAHEGIPAGKIRLVGDVMYDAALVFGEVAARDSRVVDRLGLRPKGYVLATVHRAENTDHPANLEAILRALALVASELPVVWPVHPRTRKALAAALSTDFKETTGLHLIEPVGYLDMVRLERDAAVIATDSGGVQKEAYFHRVPCVTLRTETEWVELVEAGWNRLCAPADPSAIARSILDARGRPGRDVALYGAGNTAELVATDLLGRA